MKPINLLFTILYLVIVSNTVSSQNLGWAVQAGGDGGVNERGWAVATDNAGNIYQTGIIGDGGTFGTGVNQVTVTTLSYGDFYIAKYDNDGNFLWVFTEESSFTSYGSYINIDDNGNIYVVGKLKQDITFDEGTTNPVILTGTTNADDIFIVKYNSNKQFQWARQVEGPQDEFIVNGVSMDNDNNIFIAGSYNESITVESTTLNSQGEGDIFIIKLNNAGELEWMKSEGALEWDGAYGCYNDNEGNVFVSGVFRTSVTFGEGGNKVTLTAVQYYDAFIAKYDATGNLLWAKAIGSTTSPSAQDIISDTAENCFVTGYFAHNCTFGAGTENEIEITNPNLVAENMYIAKYSSNGDFLWVKHTNGTTGNTRGKELEIESNGMCIVAGYFGGEVTFDTDTINGVGYSDIYFARYAPDGTYLGVTSDGGEVTEHIWSVCIDNNDNLFLSGSWNESQTSSHDITFGEPGNEITLSSNIWADIFLTKYLPQTVLSDENDIITFTTPEQTGDATIDNENHTVDIEVEQGTNVAALTPIITISEFATISPESGTTQDFTSPFEFTVTAENSIEQIWIVSIEIATGIEENENQVSIYPNPSTGIFNFSAIIKTISIEITDIAGKTIYTKAHNVRCSFECPLQIDLSNKPKGIYFMTIKTETGIYIEKLIIQ